MRGDDGMTEEHELTARSVVGSCGYTCDALRLHVLPFAVRVFVLLTLVRRARTAARNDISQAFCTRSTKSLRGLSLGTVCKSCRRSALACRETDEGRHVRVAN